MGAAVQLAIPVQPGLVGLPIAFQGLLVTGSAITFGGNAPLVVLR